MGEVANPAVIVGLGGTGKWVLTYIKKNLLDTYGGMMPSTIRLLSFDTTTEKVSRGGVAQEEDARVGDVQLDKNAEFVYLGGNIYQICKDIRDKGMYPHVGSWLQARTYLETADPDAFDIARGAGQKRPFGRMSIFYNLQQAVQAEITNKISTAISEVIGANERQTSIEIYIVASLAGGTGAGMFIDIAHLARWFANRQIRTGYAIRGFLALQNVFRSVVKVEQVQANAFAAMRELDRFMLVFDQQYPIVYEPSNPVLNTIYGGELGKLFDNCYLLDASRENKPLDNFAPKYGVYPSMADCITMLLDASTGDAYAQHYKNVNNRIGEVQAKLKRPIYSSLGTYNLILPVEDIITSLTHRFAIDLLGNYLLNLEQRTSETGHMQYVLRYEGNARESATDLLRTTRTAKGIESTNFVQRVPNTVERASSSDEVFTAEIARATASELLPWVLPPEGDPTVQEIARSVREDLEKHLGDRVLTSRVEKDDPVEGYGRILRGVRDFREEYLGREVNGRTTGGKYREALGKCVAIHDDRYRQVLEERLLTLLNGPDPKNSAYQAEKRGKLGLAQSMLAYLSLYFRDQAAFFERVKEKRARSEELRVAQQDAATARDQMNKDRERKGFLGSFLDSLNKAYNSQQSYIQAEQAVLDIEVNDLFIDFLKRASETLRATTDEYKASVDTWVNTLAQGLTGEINDPGTYKYLLESQARHESNREDKRRIAVHEYVTDPAYENGLYTSRTEGRHAEAMTLLTWSAERTSVGFRLSLNGCSLVGVGPIGGKLSTQRNAEFLLNIAHGYFDSLRDLTIADRLADRDPAGLATMLLDKCGPMVRYDPSKIGGAQELHYFVCVDEARQKSYFNTFSDLLRRLGASAKDNRVLDSSNPYTCTILATADVLASDGLLAYASAEREYNNHVGDARLLHIFPAEVNAVAREQQLPRIGEPRRRFSHQLTAMLEDPKVVEQFILAYLYRFIRLEKADGINNQWMLFLPSRRRRGTDRFALTAVERQPSLFDAMETFVFRKGDISNEVLRIDFQVLDQELRNYEQERAGGRESPLINLLEDVIDRDVEPMRRHSDAALRDLGSLMRLIIDEIIEGLNNRLEQGGGRHDPNDRPLPAPRDLAPAPLREPAPVSSVEVTHHEPVVEYAASATTGSNGSDGRSATPSSPPTNGLPGLDPATQGQLDVYKQMLDGGYITQEFYEAQVAALMMQAFKPKA